MKTTEHLIIPGRAKNLGEVTIWRTLPSRQKRSVGPFVFIDHMGPQKIDSAHSLEVRPHPHIGLATLTYLFSGQALHRDSLGSKQMISAGDLNLMTAGRGIVHSERTPDSAIRDILHGIQIWLALPKEQEDCEPTFQHWRKDQLPNIHIEDGLNAQLLLGEFAGSKSPVVTLSKTLLLQCQCTADLSCEVTCNEQEFALCLISGSCSVDDQELRPEDLICLAGPRRIKLRLRAGTQFVILGGDPHPEPRFIWWNFVSSSQEKIRQAAQAWQEQRMGQIESETDFYPAPEMPVQSTKPTTAEDV